MSIFKNIKIKYYRKLIRNNIKIMSEIGRYLDLQEDESDPFYKKAIKYRKFLYVECLYYKNKIKELKK